MSREEKISKSHASGVVVLIFTVLFIQVVLFLFRGEKEQSGAENKVAVEKPVYPGAVKSSGVKTGIYKQKDVEKPVILNPFDPNTIDKSGLMDLGLSSKQAQVVINYRIKGGKFRTASDFAKMYVISPKTFDRIKGYISITQNKRNQFGNDTVVKSASTAAAVTPAAVTPAAVTPATETVEILAYKKKFLLPLNRADSVELLTLPGIGPYYARKIIQYRARLGGFASKEQLLEIYGIDRQRLDMFADRIEIDTNDVVKIDLKGVSFEVLSRNPYIGGYVARSIIRYREKFGSEVTDLARLVTENIIQKELFKILKYYFK